MALATVTNRITDGSGHPMLGVPVYARLYPQTGAFVSVSGDEIVDSVDTVTDANGDWSMPLEKNPDMAPANSYWLVAEQIPQANGGPRLWQAIVTANTTLMAAAAAFLLPGPVLPTGLTVAAGDARYDLKVPAATAVQYVAATGDDANDGLSWGSAKATIGAAILTLPPGGTIIVGAGTWLIGAPAVLAAGTTLKGLGMDVTTLQLDPAHWANFGFNYLITSAAGGTACTVADLTLDGNHRAGGAAANQGGCITPDSHWKIERCRFIDCNYFKVFVNAKTGVRLVDCRWEGYAGNDNLGGGSTNRDVVVERGYWAADVASGPDHNAIDFTNGSGYQIRGCHMEAGHVYLEGTTDSTIEGCLLAGSNGITLQDDSGYSPATVTMPRNNRVVDNEIDACTIGVRVRYFLLGGGGTAIVAGGGNLVEGNVIRRSTKMAVLVDGYEDSYKSVGDIIQGNVIDQTNFDTTDTYNSGGGVFENAGIALGIGNGDLVVANRIDDSQPVPTMRYGVALSGTSVTPQVRNGTQIVGNVSRNHTLAGLVISNAAKVASDTVVRGNGGYNPKGPLTPPAVPATTVALTNPFNVDCQVHVTGGTVTVIAVGGTATGVTAGSFRVPVGQTIALTYTVAPTWTWFGD